MSGNDETELVKALLNSNIAINAYIDGIISVSRSKQDSKDKVKARIGDWIRAPPYNNSLLSRISLEDLEKIDWDTIIDWRLKNIFGGILPWWAKI